MELHHFAVHASDVRYHGTIRLWRLLFLRLDDDSVHSVRLFLGKLKKPCTLEDMSHGANASMQVPETKGIPLESMDRLFEIKPVRKAHSRVHAEDTAREEEFRHDAEGAGLDVAKEKLDHIEHTIRLPLV